MEKDVSGIFSGTASSASLNTCESHITSEIFPILSKASFISFTCTSIAMPCLSSISLITCCCGNISLPFGAEASIGVTKSIISFSFIILPKTVFSFLPSDNICDIIFLSLSILIFFSAETYISTLRSFFIISQSHLFPTIRYFLSLDFILSKNVSSSEVASLLASATKSIKSA